MSEDTVGLSHPALDADELPDDDGRVWFTNSSSVVHLFDGCPHVYHAEEHVATPETFGRVWSEDVDRRQLKSSLRWCTWCQQQYIRGEYGDGN